MIYLASDHRGFKLKEKIKQWLMEWGYQVEDKGAHSYEAHDDFPDFVAQAAEKVSQDPANSKAIILGASGQGEAMLANRYKGVRAAVYYGGPEEIITLSRKHNDANVLALGASFLNEETAHRVIKRWLETPFSEDQRHKRRIKKMEQ